MNRSPLQSALRELREHLRDPRTLGIMAVAGVLLGLAGPFGTFETIGLLPRLAYWLATVLLTYCFGYFISKLADSLWGEGKPVWLRFVIMVIPAGLGATLIVALLNTITFGALEPAELPLLVAQCYAVAAGVVLVIILTERQAPVATVSGKAGAPVPPPILERVPLPQRGVLLALVVEDHYVDIVTDRGKTLVLMRLADAIREADSVPGLQIHRSHWVARDAVVRAHRSDGRVVLELRNGLRLPVSRGYLPRVREAGLA